MAPPVGALQAALCALVITAVLYNMVLAALGARGLPISYGIVAGVEVAILAAGLLMTVATGLTRKDTPVLAFLYATAVLAAFMSVVHGRIIVDGLRNFLIVGVFLLVGHRCTARSIERIFLIVGVVVAAVLALEIINLEWYVYLFHPADYFSKTRGIATPEFLRERGLAIGTIAYEGRFSFGIWHGSRTSSVFLEQVGINTYAIVLTIYLSCMWKKLPRWQILLFAVLYTAIIVTNNARLAPIVGVIILFGYLAFPKLPRFSQFMIPICILSGVFLLFEFVDGRSGDDLLGRMWTTYRFLRELDISQYLMGDPGLLRAAGDTGYGYLICSMTLLGTLIYAAFVIFICPQESDNERRLSWGVCTYIFFWILVGGTGAFTIKTAPLLWALVGNFRRRAGGAIDDGAGT